MKYHFKVHKVKKGGYWTVCLELEGCRTQAETMEELLANSQEALDLYLSEPEDSKLIFPKPKRNFKGKNVISVSPSPSVAFATVLRELRLRQKLTLHQMKEALGIKNLSVYQRLENPRLANPELKTLAKIKLCFPELKIEDIF